MSKTKIPFDVMLLDDAPMLVTNPYSGESITLTPEEIAVYDVTMGAEMLGDYETVRKGIDWFKENNPEAYMILLD